MIEYMYYFNRLLRLRFAMTLALRVIARSEATKQSHEFTNE